MVSPGQWDAKLTSPCVVFGSNAEYVQLFKDTFGYDVGYNGAAHTVAGIMLQVRMLGRVHVTHEASSGLC